MVLDKSHFCDLVAVHFYGWIMDLAIALNIHSPLPLHQQLYQELRQAILNGRQSPVVRIPSTRSLAKSLNISRTTVI